MRPGLTFTIIFHYLVALQPTEGALFEKMPNAIRSKASKIAENKRSEYGQVEQTGSDSETSEAWGDEGNSGNGSEDLKAPKSPTGRKVSMSLPRTRMSARWEEAPQDSPKKRGEGDGPREWSFPPNSHLYINPLAELDEKFERAREVARRSLKKVVPGWR
ncbi:hypothetical protein FOZ63_006238 [Perkinsus olseni]|uniref:Uncharacterized protein n=1 Tax=Perkinsus olseni TaxID=32597 RepID=A0A7J6SYN3_PEROL|nr:hypothetical protein FOZ63_006238 [Perkinsus olseni]KAF4754422.1 hypothetical protein FOZ62_007916 [Perkinsus olseni]